MTYDEDEGSGRERGSLGGLIALLVAIGAAAFYFAVEEFDLLPKSSGQMNGVGRVSPAPDKKPIPPSFDIAAVDGRGVLVAAGRGQPGWTIRIENRGLTIGEVRADANGEWTFIPETPLDPGQYELSLTATDPKAEGILSGARPVSLSVAPRERTAKTTAGAGSGSMSMVTKPDVAGSNMPQKSAGLTACHIAIVKQGDTLWQMADECYGDGTKYSKIFRSNQPQIKNPNLIYPDQQVTVPRD